MVFFTVSESSGPGFEAVSLQNFCGGNTLLRLFPSPDPIRVGASSTGSALFFLRVRIRLELFSHRYSSPNIQHLIPYSYPNTQITYL
jgi:hypothetical protein